MRTVVMLMLLLAAFPFRGNAGGRAPEVSRQDSALYASLRRLECRADSGDPKALYDLAYVYELGYGPVEPDSLRSLLLYGKSAEAGYAPAQNYLGYRLFNGEGVERDCIRGLDLIEKAAMQGDAKGAANLGWLLAAGEGVERDPEKAVYWLGKASDAGLPVAMMQLAAIYAEGLPPVAPDTLKASGLLSEAARKGVADADASLLRLMRSRWQALEATEAVCLGLSFFTGGDAPESAVGLFRIAAGKGSAQAYALLGEAYALGKGAEYDHKESLLNFCKAAEMGNPSAQFIIAETLDVFPDALTGLLDSPESGRGGMDAAFWYGKAAQAGVTSAAEAHRRLCLPPDRQP